MDSKNAKERIDFLTNKLHEYNREYYIHSNSIVSDFEFDKMLEELVILEDTFPLLKHTNSPTERVGGELSKTFNTVTHKYPMLSLGNTYNEEELNEFTDRINKTLDTDTVEYICEQKFDGVAISLWYEKGILVKAVTRGDGEKGDDVLANVKTIKTIPIVLNPFFNFPEEFEVRGEVFLPRKNFEKINKELQLQGKPTLANPRNSASGTLKMQDSKVVAARGLDCYIYSLLSDRSIVDSHENALLLLNKSGFNISPTWKKCLSVTEILDYIHVWETKRKSLALDTDGVVIKVNNFTQQKFLGFTSKSPRWATAFKYKPENASTLLKSITYQVGRTGAITPVAELDEVELSGTKVRRASLHNADEIERLGLHFNDYVFVEKGGEIIPKVTAVDISKRKSTSAVISYITNCPECNTLLVRKDGEAVHYCPNDLGCKPQILGRLEHFVSRNALNIDSVGTKTIEQLFNIGLLKEISDLYKLTYETLLTLEGFKEKAVLNVLEGIENSKKMPFEKVLFGLGIRYVGETIAEKLANHFLTVEAIQNASFEDLKNAPEIGEKIAASIIEYFSKETHRKLVSDLQHIGLKFVVNDSQKQIVSSILNEKTFVITGVFENYERDQLKKIIISNGGKVLSGVSSKLNYLLAGEGVGPSKMQKAVEVGVKVIGIEDFENLLKK